MQIVIDILHLVAAAALSLIGFGYEREEECEPVRFQPAAYVEYADAQGEYAEARFQTVEDCGAAPASARLPVL
ncbi:MAG: hypothetical protein ACLFQ5_12470 [Oceanicaulis sp.]